MSKFIAGDCGSAPETPNPDMVDRKIEDAVRRATFDPDYGELAITVQPGEGLGELRVNVQFEGRTGEYEFCTSGQNAMLFHTMEWLREILGEGQTDFSVSMTSQPCPKAKQKVDLEHAMNILQGRIRESGHRPEHSASSQQNVARERNIEQKRGRE